jgi:hypothetical protein
MKFQLILSLLFLSFLSHSQPPEYDDLKIYYADGNYEKLVDKADKYTQKDDTKKDPHPYMWATKGLYKISISGNNDPEYKNAFKDALGYFGKSMKYDEDGSCLNTHMEFVNEFTKAAVELIVNDVEAGDFNKAYSWNVKYAKAAKDPAAAKYMEGACKFNKGDKSGANTAWKEADEMLKDVTSLDSWLEADRKLLKIAVIQSADCLMKSRQLDKAKDLMNRFAPWFDTQDDFKVKYDEIIN